jgi:hypothetical protein
MPRPVAVSARAIRNQLDLMAEVRNKAYRLDTGG